MLKNFKKGLAVLAILALPLAAACSDVSAPVQPEPTETLQSLTSATQLQLNRILEEEKERIKRAQEASKPTYDSLKVEWERFLRSGSSGGSSSSTLVMCDPLQYVGQTKIIGPLGGSIDFGPHKLLIPAGALATWTVITAEAPTTLGVSAVFSPHGTRFLVQPELILSYKHCRGLSPQAKAVGYIVNGQITERPYSQDRQSDGLVRSWIGHFSEYALIHP